LVLLPVALTPSVVTIVIGACSFPTFPITFPLLATRGILLPLLKPASLFPGTVCLLRLSLRALRTLLRLTYLILALLRPTLFAFLGS
jgi:hypothetical protein